MVRKPSSSPGPGRRPPDAAGPRPRIVIAVVHLPAADAPADRIARRDAQRRAARVLARAAAAELTGAAPGDFTVMDGGDTPPRLAPARPSLPPLTLSLAHSGPWAGAAVATECIALGFDLQCRTSAPVDRLAAFMGWTPWVPAGDADAFTRLWTLWEAAVKCDGTGVLAPRAPAFDALRPGCAGSHWAAGAAGCQGAGWSVAPGCWLAVVARPAGDAMPDLTVLRVDGAGTAD